ncbi:MAG: NADH-quinone oxidoreductase subunit M [Candidatus Marsarchaeota archaeon]|nr:NADH-quinone oxidoreductase subunit M [Candidatus Marsarchaeota archaeon]
MIYIILILFAMLAAGIALVPISPRALCRRTALIFSGVVFAIILHMIFNLLVYNILPYSESLAYIPELNTRVLFTVTPISMILMLMTSIISIAALLSIRPILERERGLSFLIMLFQLSSIGLFLSYNLLLFFMFWEMGIITVFMLINIFGSSESNNASMRFLMYSIVSSSLLLLGIILIYLYTPAHSLNIDTIIANSATIPYTIGSVIFAIMFTAFMIKIPLFPFHSWVGSAYAEAPTSGSVVISGILSKYGLYGIFMLFVMFNTTQSMRISILIIAAISAFYSVFVAIKSRDIKVLLAYTGIVESAIILIGITSGNATGYYGAIYGMFAYGLSIALLFLAAGTIEQMYGSRSVDNIKAIVKNSASTAYAFIFGVFAATGLPLTGIFIADILIFTSGFESFGILALIPIATIMIIAAYLYRIISKSVLNSKEPTLAIRGLESDRIFAYIIIIAAIIFIGVFPSIMLSIFSAS